MKVLIATSTIPKSEENFKEICALIRRAAIEENLTVVEGILWTMGPGCTNLAFEIIGDEEMAETFAKSVTMALMPSKWTTTKDELPTTDTWIS